MKEKEGDQGRTLEKNEDDAAGEVQLYNYNKNEEVEEVEEAEEEEEDEKEIEVVMENLAEKKVQNDSEYISVEKSEDNYNSTLNPEETDFNINTNYIENDIYLNYDQ